MTVSQFESLMDRWINAAAFLNDLNILSNYDFTILLFLQINSISQRENVWARGSIKLPPNKDHVYRVILCSLDAQFTFPQDHRLWEGKDVAQGLPHIRCSLIIVVPESCML